MWKLINSNLTGKKGYVSWLCIFGQLRLGWHPERFHRGDAHLADTSSKVTINIKV